MKINLFAFFGCLLLSGCSVWQQNQKTTNLDIPTSTTIVLLHPTNGSPTEQSNLTELITNATVVPTLSMSTPLPSITITPDILFSFQSPLKDISIQDLHLIISNPFVMPQIGKDDGHHGVDFAFYDFKKFGNIENHQVLSVFPGKIAAITEDLPPYGNMIIIESSGNFFSSPQAKNLIYSLPSKEYNPSPQLSCPSNLEALKNNTGNISLYLLYAHLKEIPTFNIGDEIKSGDTVGFVGNTGMSGNPHLHLEFRIGPADFLFQPMGHYDNTLNNEQMEAYCLWRVSGWFNPMDPMLFFDSVKQDEN